MLRPLVPFLAEGTTAGGAGQHRADGAGGASFAAGEDSRRARGAGAQAAGQVVVAVGPLTNIAHALQSSPQIKPRIAEIALMGGSTDRGNHTPAAEFNIYADPEAADIVFSSGVPLRMFGLNVCRQVLLTREHVQQVKRGQDAWFAGHLEAYQRIRSADGSVPMPLYDPVIAAWLARPGLFTFQPARVDIELQGRFTRGMTVCDFRRPPNAQVAMTADGPAVLSYVLQTLHATLGAR